DRFAKTEIHVALSHLMDQLVDDLGVDELEGPVAAVDHRHLHAKRGEHRCVFDADHSCANDHQCARQSFETADVVAGDNCLAVRLEVGGRYRARPTGNEDIGGGNVAPGPAIGDAYAVRVDESGLAAHHIDAVA